MANALYPPSAISPARSAVAVVPHDTNLLPFATKALYVGTAGNLTVTMRDGADAQFKNVPAGFLLDVDVTRVKVTGTSATDIVALG